MIWKTYWWGVVNLFIDSSVEELLMPKYKADPKVVSYDNSI